MAHPEARPIRPPIQPARSMQGGATAAAIGVGIARAVSTSNPELAALEPVIAVAITGFLAGVGNSSRNRLARDRTGVVGLVAGLFSWLG